MDRNELRQYVADEPEQGVYIRKKGASSTEHRHVYWGEMFELAIAEPQLTPLQLAQIEFAAATTAQNETYEADQRLSRAESALKKAELQAYWDKRGPIMPREELNKLAKDSTFTICEENSEFEVTFWRLNECLGIMLVKDIIALAQAEPQLSEIDRKKIELADMLIGLEHPYSGTATRADADEMLVEIIDLIKEAKPKPVVPTIQERAAEQLYFLGRGELDAGCIQMLLRDVAAMEARQ